MSETEEPDWPRTGQAGNSREQETGQPTGHGLFAGENGACR